MSFIQKDYDEKPFKNNAVVEDDLNDELTKPNIFQKVFRFFKTHRAAAIALFAAIGAAIIIPLVVINVKYQQEENHVHKYINGVCKCGDKEKFEITIVDEYGNVTTQMASSKDDIVLPKITPKEGYNCYYADYELKNGSITYVVYEPIIYNIKYITGNVTTENNNPLTYTIESAKIIFSDLVSEDYDFLGFYRDPSYYDKITEINPGSKGDLIIYAKWNVKQTKISFKMNGGSGNIEDVYVNHGTYYTLDVTNPTKTAYTFIGWSTTSKGEVEYQNGDSIFASQEKLVLYAIYTPNVTTINYHNADGEILNTQTVMYLIQTNLFDEKPVKVGYTHIGWAIEKDSNQIEYQIKDAFNATSDNVTIDLYPVYRRNTTTIYFNDNNSMGEMENIIVLSGVKINIPECTFEKRDHYFLGYSLEKNGEAIYKEGDEFTAGNEDAQITLYCQWVQYQTITIKFDLNGGQRINTKYSFDDIRVVLLQTVELPTEGLSRGDEYFAGWSLSSDKTSGINYTDSYTYNVPIQGSELTLYAYYAKRETTFTFNANGGVGSMADYVIQTGITGSLPMNTFTRTGYKFKGWSTSSDAINVDYYNGSSYAAPNEYKLINLYAVWERYFTTVRFNTEDGIVGQMESLVIYSLENTKLTKNIFIKEGYYFAGWSNELNGEVLYEDEAIFTASNDKNETIYLYTVFKQNSTQINYRSNNEKDEERTETFTYDPNNISRKTLKNQFSDVSKKFVGWCLDPNGVDSPILDDEFEIEILDERKIITYYAIWISNQTKLSFVYESQHMDDIIVNANTVGYLPVCTFVKEGYTFKYWLLEGSDKAYYAGDEILAGNDEMTYYFSPIFEKKETQIHFDSNGGTGTMASVAIKSFEYVELEFNSIIAPTGMHFVGWGLNNTDVSYLVGDYYTKQDDFDNDVTLYAIWEKNINTLELYLDIDELYSSFAFDCYLGDTITVKDPEKKFYTFKGWSIYPNSNTAQYQSNVFFKLNHLDEYKLYAVFEEIPGSVGLSYRENKVNGVVKTLSVVGYSGASSDVFIPHTVNDIPVVEIADHAFDGNSVIESISFGDNVTSIGLRAFEGSSLKYITFNNNPMTIKDYAFKSTGLVEFTYPTNINSIGKGILSNTSKLTNVDFGNATAIEDQTFYGSGIESITIPGTIKTIGYDAFYNSKIKNVVLNEGLTFIDKEAFSNASRLNEIIIPSTLKTIGYYAFGQSGLKKVDFSKANQLEIEAFAFSFCENLEELKLEGIIDVISDSAFKMSGIKTLSITTDISYVNSNCFTGCTELKTVELSNTITRIYNNAFSGCEKLETINLSNVKTIYTEAFKDCPSLNNINLNRNGLKVEKDAFKGCEKLESVYLASNVTSIAEQAFDRRYVKLVFVDDDTYFDKINATTNFNCDYTYYSEEEPTERTIEQTYWRFVDDMPEEWYRIVEIRLHAGYLLSNNVVTKKVILPDVNFARDEFSVTGYELVGYSLKDGNNGIADYFTGQDNDVEFTSYTMDLYAVWQDTAYKDLIMYSEKIDEATNYKYFQILSFRDTTNEQDKANLILPTYILSEMFDEYYPVTEIIANAFMGEYLLEEVKLPALLETVGDSAFQLASISIVNIPSTVVSIGNLAFANNEYLLSANITGNPELGKLIFAGCSNLVNINLGNNLETIGESMFKDCTSLATINLPDTIKVIKKGAFENTSSLKSIYLPDSLEGIEERPFVHSGIEEIKMGPDCKINELTIDHFTNASELKTIYLSKNTASINDEIFLAHPKLRNIYSYMDKDAFESLDMDLPSNLALYFYSSERPTDNDVDYFYMENNNPYVWVLYDRIINFYPQNGSHNFVQQQISSYIPTVLNRNIFAYNGYIFCGWTLDPEEEGRVDFIDEEEIFIKDEFKDVEVINLYAVWIDESVYLDFEFEPAMGMGEFICRIVKYTGTSGIVHIPNYWFEPVGKKFYKVISLDEELFRKDKNIMNVSITKFINNDFITRIPYQCFYNQTTFEEIDLKNVTSIDSQAFYVPYTQTVTNRATLDLSNVTSLGTYVFYSCSYLEKVILSSSITNISQSTFYACSNLKEINLENVTNIQDYAFINCDIRFADLSKCITIGNSAFSGNGNMENVILGGDLSLIGDSAFENCRNLTTPLVQLHVGKIGYKAFYNTLVNHLMIDTKCYSIGNQSLGYVPGSVSCYYFKGDQNAQGFPSGTNVIYYYDDSTMIRSHTWHYNTYGELVVYD